MIRHVVLVKFARDVSREERDEIFADLAALKARVPGFLAFAAGPNVSPENLDRGFTEGFVVTFDSPEGRDRYLADEEHGRVGARLVSAADGGIDGLIVFDLETPD
jgi:hypothetical protein